jgi:hypothetical protein
VKVGDRVQTPLAKLTGTVISFPERSFPAALVKFDPGQEQVTLLEVATYPQSILTVIDERGSDAE